MAVLWCFAFWRTFLLQKGLIMQCGPFPCYTMEARVLGMQLTNDTIWHVLTTVQQMALTEFCTVVPSRAG